MFSLWILSAGEGVYVKKNFVGGLAGKIVAFAAAFSLVLSVTLLAARMVVFPPLTAALLHREILWSAGAVCVAVVASSIFAYFIAGHTLKPILLVTKAAQTAASGDLDIFLERQSSDEIGDLSDSFGLMIKRLRGSIARVQRLAYIDPVTDLPNRSHFKRVVERQISATRLAEKVGAVLFMDMDRFKTVNDTLGHALGDRLLEMFAERIKVVVQSYDNYETHLDMADSMMADATGQAIFARLGGDEFTVLLPCIQQPSEASRLAQRILRSLHDPFELGGHSVTIGASIGIACFPGNGEDYDTLMRNADTAMYHAKELGRNNYQFFSADLNRRALERMVLESQLRDAIAQKQFEVFYQPQVDARSRALVGVEALVRWRHPTVGIVTPETFIDLAEEAGFIHEIGAFVLRSAVAQAAVWVAEGHPVRVSVNVSASQFNRADFVSLVTDTLDASNLDPCWLELEVTETLTMQDNEAVEARLARLRDIGIAIAMDDFGTGYSNLALLKRLQFDRLKIDRSFVSDIDSLEDARTIVSTILAMAQTFGYDVVAEGVETEAQAAILEAGGCHVLQGYLVSRPLALEAFTAWRDSQLTIVAEPVLLRAAG
jgi:predicted signal transduction protein with EAL and GGDEF domain